VPRGCRLAMDGRPAGGQGHRHPDIVRIGIPLLGDRHGKRLISLGRQRPLTRKNGVRQGRNGSRQQQYRGLDANNQASAHRLPFLLRKRD
jgi:hypothetical protein